MVGGLDHESASWSGVDTQVGEELQAERLGAVGDQHHLNPADADGGAVAQRGLGRSEALPTVARHGRSPSPWRRWAGRRWARSCRRSAAEWWRRRRRPCRCARRSGSQIGPTRRVLDAALDQPAQDGGVVGGRAAAGIVGRVGHHDRRAIVASAAAMPASHLEVIRHRSCRAWRRTPRRVLVANASALALSPSATTRIAAGHLRHVGIGEAVADGDRQDAVLALHAP